MTLLRYMNSAAVGLNRRISSIRDAIVFLGTETIRSFAYLVSLTAHSQQPTELARIGMVRAPMMELLGPAPAIADRATHFTVGLLSVADALLSVPMDVLLDELDELDDAREARARRPRGRAGRAGCAWSSSYELGRLDQLEAAGVSPLLVRDAYLRAVEWADETAACARRRSTRAPAAHDPLRRAS